MMEDPRTRIRASLLLAAWLAAASLSACAVLRRPAELRIVAPFESRLELRLTGEGRFDVRNAGEGEVVLLRTLSSGAVQRVTLAPEERFSADYASSATLVLEHAAAGAGTVETHLVGIDLGYEGRSE